MMPDRQEVDARQEKVRLSSSVARSIAEAMWGRGGTSAIRMNRTGAYGFQCSSHGGFVIDAAAFKPEERQKIEGFAEAVTARVWLDADDNVALYFHPERRKGASVFPEWREVQASYYVFEEDADWCLPVVMAGVGPRDSIADPEYLQEAKDAFWRHHDPKNPEIQHRREVEAARQAGDPDLVVSAIGDRDGVRVQTADGREWQVEGYDEARDAFGTPWLSRCRNPRLLEPESSASPGM